MPCKPLLFAASLTTLALPMLAQQPVAPPAPQPLTAMPYSPSLDLTSLDRSVNPCTDFYKFSCGGWMKNNPIPADQASWSVYAKLGNANQQFLWGILEADSKPSPTRTAVQQKVGDYYESCMNTADIDAAGEMPVRAALARLGLVKVEPPPPPGVKAPVRIPRPQPPGAGPMGSRPQVLNELNILLLGTPGNYFFGGGVGQDAVNSSQEIVELRAGGLGLPDRDYYIKMDPRSATIREQYASYIAKLMQLAGESPDQAHSDADAALKVETVLANATLTRVERRDPHKTYHLMTVAELSKLVPAINWNGYLLGHAGVAANNVTQLNVSQPRFMEAVQNELTNEDPLILQAYLRVHLLSAAAPYLATPFEQASFDFFSHTLRGVTQEPPRWKTCVRAVDRNLGEALGQEFVARTFGADMKAKTQLITEQIETAMGQEIQALDWMSAETKAEALRKLHAIRNKIGYPETWRDYTKLEVKRDDYFGDMLRAYAFESRREWNKLGKPVD